MKKSLFTLMFALIMFFGINNVYAVSCEDAQKMSANGKYDQQISELQSKLSVCGENNYPGYNDCIKNRGLSDTATKLSNLKNEKANYLNELVSKNCKGSNAISKNTEYDESYDNYDDSDVTCGNGLTFNKSIVNTAYYFILVFQIATPILLIVIGMIDLFKAVVAQKDDAMKKAQSVFLKKLLLAVLLFFVIAIAKLIVSIFGDTTIINCFDCFMNGASKC